MARLHYPLRRTMVAAAMMVLCVYAVLVSATYTDAEQTNTLKFLQLFAESNPSLKSQWTGTDVCTWLYVICNAGAPTELNFGDDLSPYTESLVLPELDDGVDGAAVIVTSIIASGSGQLTAGTLPASWGRLKRLTKVDLSGNALTGPLPADWGELTQMQSLSLSRNSLSGTLPPQWVKMAVMVTMQLASNALTGSIPHEWYNISANMLDLRGNHLCGCMLPEWATNSHLNPRVDRDMSASNCATANMCPAVSTTTTTTSPAPSPASSSSKAADSSSSTHSTTTTTTTSPAPSPVSSSSRAHSSAAKSGNGSNSNEAGCEVLYCVRCQAGSTTSCGECARSYELTTNFQCVQGDGAVRVSLTAGGHLWAALLLAAALWVCSASV